MPFFLQMNSVVQKLAKYQLFDGLTFMVINVVEPAD